MSRSTERNHENAAWDYVRRLHEVVKRRGVVPDYRTEFIAFKNLHNTTTEEWAVLLYEAVRIRATFLALDLPITRRCAGPRPATTAQRARRA